MLKQNKRIVAKSLKIKKISNLLIGNASRLLSNMTHKSHIWGYPTAVMIEPTNVCNLKCPLCPSGNGTLKRAKGFMEFSLFKKVIDEVKEYATMIILWNQGEPYLNKDFNKMVKYATDAGLFTLVSTNLNADMDAEEVVKSGLDSMIVSLDGSTQETYNQYRVNGNLEKVLSNVEKLVAAKKKLKSNTPIIRWQFLVMKHNEHEIEEIKQKAKELEVDQLSFKTIQIYTKEDIKFLPINPKYRRYNISGEDFEIKFKMENKCRRMWQQPVVNWNGDVAICCFDKDIEFPVGNVKEQSLLSIWQGKPFQNMRNAVLKNRKAFEICRNCGEGVKLRIEEKNR
ncbi:MAG: radical SAM/SPASM domain-containing protein [Candidatus Cloacimonadales bacterium]